MSRFLLPLAVLLLSACAGPAVQVGDAMPPRAAIRDFSLDARFSVTHEAERHSGRLSWRHAGASDELQLSSPFGQVVAEVQIDSRRARLVASDRRVYEAPDVQQLTREVLGYPLPIRRLSEWVLGRESGRGQVEKDALGRPSRIEDDGWQISYEYDQESGDALPARLVVTRPGGPDLRLRIEEWRSGGQRE